MSRLIAKHSLGAKTLSSVEELSTIEKQIEEGIEAEKRILSYADTLITAMNERLETGGLQPGVPEPHPCSLRTSQIWSDELKNDYLDLANCCQRHVCRLDGYCKSRKKGKENECRFGYPFKIEPVSRIEFSETENSVKHIF